MADAGRPEQPAQRVVGAQQAPVLVAAHLGDGHARGRVLEGLPEAFLAGAQGLLLTFEADQGALHVCAQPGVADRNRGLGRIHLERFTPPGAGLASVAGFVDGDDAEQFLGAAGGVHRGVQPVLRVPLVLEAGIGALGVPLGDVVLQEHPALGVRDEAQPVPVLAHRQAPLPGGARADPAGDQRFRRRVAGEGRDDQVTVGAYEVDAGQLVAEPGDDAVRDGLQRVRKTAGRIELPDHLVQLPQGRKTDVGLRLGLHCSLSPRPRQQLLASDRHSFSHCPATESQRAV